MLHATDDHRRARLARRHALSAEHRLDDVVAATTAMTVLHATEVTTPHLSLCARVREVTVADVDSAIYVARSLVKVTGMRRTLFLAPRDLVPAVAGSAGRRAAGMDRRRFEKEIAGLGLPAGWIDEACAAVLAELEGDELTVAEMRVALAHLDATVVAAAGTRWATEVSTMSRLVAILAAEGSVVRAHNRGHWRISRPSYTSSASWLGEDVEPWDEGAGYAEIVRRWLWTFGPGTEADLAWWLGSTKTAARRALADVGAVEVSLDGGGTGFVLPEDTDDLEEPPDVEPYVALLPTLDPTTMGWRERGFYLDAARVPYLVDSVGNAGTTVWVDGRVVGCWVQDEDERVRPILLEDLPARVRRRIDDEASRLDGFIGGEHVTNVYAARQKSGRTL